MLLQLYYLNGETLVALNSIGNRYSDTRGEIWLHLSIFHLLQWSQYLIHCFLISLESYGKVFGWALEGWEIQYGFRGRMTFFQLGVVWLFSNDLLNKNL